MISVDEINKLKEELENREMFIDQLKEYNNQLKARIRPFEDSYFNGLSSIEIAELAKKSIRLACENRKLENALEKIKEIAENNRSAPCLEIGCDCEHCEDECTENGEFCMENGLNKILQIISDCEGENE